MSYLVCNKCGGYYELKDSESPDDFEDKCECGGDLHFVDSLSEDPDKSKNPLTFDRWVKIITFWIIFWGIINLIWTPIGGAVLIIFGVIIYATKKPMIITVFGAIWALLTLIQTYMGFTVNWQFFILAAINGYSTVNILYRVNKFQRKKGKNILTLTAIFLIIITVIFALIIVSGIITDQTDVFSSSGGATGVQVVVNYSGEWNGTISTNGKIMSVHGKGPQTFNLNKIKFVNSYFQKTDGGNSRITASIMQNGQVIETSRDNQNGNYANVKATLNF